MIKRVLISFVFVCVISGCGAKSMLRYPPHMWLRDRDEIPFAFRWERSGPYRNIDSDLFNKMGRGADITKNVSDVSSFIMISGRQEALDLNNFDEVADSSWFTNRIGRFDMTPDEVAAGPPNRVPMADGPLSVIGMTTVYGMPRLVVVDGAKRVYIIKFDPKGYPRVATGAEMISSKFIYAAGYSVPDDSLLMLDRSRLVLSEDAWMMGQYGKQLPMKKDDFDAALENTATDSKGRYYAISVRLYDGFILGPFNFVGKRGDDPNDRIPHEHRRELRALKVFFDYLGFAKEHTFATLDVFKFVDGESGYITHNLFDLSESLGSSDVNTTPEERYAESGFHATHAAAALLTFGIYDPYGENSAPKLHEDLGIVTTDDYNPGQWGSVIQNAAFSYMTKRDALWAAKILSRFSDDDIRAIVATAGYTKPELGKTMSEVLITRRDKIVKYYFEYSSPLSDFAMSGDGGAHILTFSDLGISEGFFKAEDTSYRAKICTFKERHDVTPWTQIEGPLVTIPDDVLARMADRRIYRLKVELKRGGEKWWRPSTDLFIEKDGGALKLIGLEYRDRS